MARNIVLLSDGTGNSAARLFRTNVWRLYGALDVTDPERQVAYYDNGVGTSSFRPLAVLGGVFGFGLKRNVLDLYRFACRTYRPGDRIFGFGFSRGAFTIRVVAGLIARQGLVPYHGNEAQLARDALVAYRAYRERFNVTGGLVTPLRRVRDAVTRAWRCVRGQPQFDPAAQVHPDAIHFLGVWDTVAAYGGPLEEVTRGIDYWLWPLSMPDRFMSAKIRRACHAVALDDERNAFWPVLWDEDRVSAGESLRGMTEGWLPPGEAPLADIDRQRLSQVWFAGMHSDVGGGYAQDGLSHVALEWMMDRALVYGLVLEPAERTRLRELADAFDKLNDSRHGMGGYYRYKPRKLADVYGLDPVKASISGDLSRMARTITGKTSGDPADAERTEAEGHSPGGPEPEPIIHESVFRRIAAGLDGYAPVVLPAAYRVTTRTGEVQRGAYEHPTQAVNRARRQERAWNWVWLRRVVYFATVIAALYLGALPWMVEGPHEPAVGSWAAFLIPVIDAVGGYLPDLASPWLVVFKAAPGCFAIGAGLVAGLLYWGGVLQRRINDVMLMIWRPVVSAPPRAVPLAPRPGDVLFRARTSRPYRGFFYALTHWVLPTASVVLIVYAVAVAGSRGLFAVGESLGLVCGGTKAEQDFNTKALCHATGQGVEAGKRYEVALKISGPWWDGYQDAAHPGIRVEAGPNGFGWNDTTARMVPWLPFRRHLTESWLRVIVRVGETGRDNQPLSFTSRDGDAAGEKVYTATFTARSTGKVYLFVNDAVIGLPWVADLFYGNNNGTAKVTIAPGPGPAQK